MFFKKPSTTVEFRDIPEAKKYWGWFFAVGVLLVILGALAIGFAAWATEFTVIFLGFLLLLSGALLVTSSYYSKRWNGFSLSLIMGLFYIIAGALCVFKPLQSAEGITLLIAALLLVVGSFRLFSSIRYQFEYWKWSAFSGAISILLGFLILAEWPASSFWVIGVFVGVDLLLAGWSWIILSLAARE